jgi:seryl-tRNA(Sec) selenium transferase
MGLARRVLRASPSLLSPTKPTLELHFLLLQKKRKEKKKKNKKKEKNQKKKEIKEKEKKRNLFP